MSKCVLRRAIEVMQMQYIGVKSMLKRLCKRLGLGKFGRNQKGSVKLLVGLSTPLVLLMTGAGLDTAELYRARINFQNAVDAGTLMAAKTLAGTGSTSKAATAGEEVFYANIRSIAEDISHASITFDMGSGDCISTPVTSNATLQKRVFFAFIRAATRDVVNEKGGTGIIDGTQKATDAEHMVEMNASADVECGSDTIEIAMVLDNSGSMGYNSKIETLRSAASNLVNTLHTTIGQQITPDPLKFSLVPFSSMVNIGASNKNASWMDTTGVSPIHHEHLNWSEDPSAVRAGNVWRTASGQPLTRFTLYDQLPGVSWEGCVEARPHPHHTQDTLPSTNNPESMFVPSFAPDTPDNWTGQYEQIWGTHSSQETCTSFQSQYYYDRYGRLRTRSSRRCRVWSDGYRGDVHPQDWGYRPYWDDRIEYQRGEFIGSNEEVTDWYNGNQISEEKFQNNYLKDDHNFPSSLGNAKSRTYTGTGADQYKRQSWTWKYFNSPNPRDVNNDRSGIPSVVGLPGGPNNFCDSQAITDLTTDQPTVINAISSMIANGATNVQAGVAWGWRTLSPDEPFTQGRSYNIADNKKIMIVMTDGNNTAYPIDYFYSGYSKANKGYYNTWGHSENERLFEGFDEIANPTHDFNTFRKAMDEHLIETCTNAKAAGITIYSIAFDVPNGSSVKSMLETCASNDLGGTKLYYDAGNNAELVATFQRIAEKLAELAITR